MSILLGAIAQFAIVSLVAAVVQAVFLVGLSGWVINQTPAPAGGSLINDPRVIPAEFAFNTDNRRVATMPGALMLES